MSINPYREFRCRIIKLRLDPKGDTAPKGGHGRPAPAPGGDPARLRNAFARDFGAREVRWSGRNLSRFLTATGERPARTSEMRDILIALGVGEHRWSAPAGILDHGELWSRAGRPWAVVSHPYVVRDEWHPLLAELAGFGTLKVFVGDRLSHYGHGTIHVRIELAEPIRPYAANLPSTRTTRSVARAARRAFLAEGLG